MGSLATPTREVWPGTMYMIDARKDWYAENGVAVLGYECLAKGFLCNRWGTREEIGRDMFQDYRDERLRTAYLTETNIDRRDRLVALAKRKGTDAASLALAYCLKQPYDSFALVGTTKLKNFLVNQKATQIDLTPAEVSWLENGKSKLTRSNL